MTSSTGLPVFDVLRDGADELASLAATVVGIGARHVHLAVPHGSDAGADAVKALAGDIGEYASTAPVATDGTPRLRLPIKDSPLILPETDLDGARVVADRLRLTVEKTAFNAEGEPFSDDEMLEAQPATSFMQRIEDWFFSHIPLEGEL